MSLGFISPTFLLSQKKVCYACNHRLEMFQWLGKVLSFLCWNIMMWIP